MCADLHTLGTRSGASSPEVLGPRTRHGESLGERTLDRLLKAIERQVLAFNRSGREVALVMMWTQTRSHHYKVGDLDRLQQARKVPPKLRKCWH